MKLAKNYAPELVRTAYLPIAATVIAVFFSTTPVSAQTLVSGVYRTDVTWTIAGHPYVITSSLAVAAGATLTIQPGVVVKFGKSDSLDRLNVWAGGTLRVNGLPGHRVVFTSVEDDSVAGDTGGDGATAGAPGQWNSIAVSGTAHLAHTDVRYGAHGSSSTLYGALEANDGASLFLSDVSVRYGERSGLKVSSAASVTVVASDFSWNATGISVYNSAIAISGGTTVTNNTARGIWVNYSNYTGIPMTVMNSNITDNPAYGFWLQVGSTTPSSSYPYGHENNIFNNGSGADMRQLYPLYGISAADWTNNYWGDVREAVPCPLAPAGYNAVHLSYSSSNPYTEAVKPGPVRYVSHSKVENGQARRCGSDLVRTALYASGAFSNSPQPAPRPTLTLFLDADPDSLDSGQRFQTSNPQSDDQFFLPGTDFNGYDRGIPQRLELIAAYVDNGQIVAPPYGVSQTTFSLADTTAYRGRTMNAGDEEAPDYGFDGDPLQAFRPDHTTRITVWCRDYGGFTVVRVTDGFQPAELQLPWDRDRNAIPDIGWRASDLEHIDDRLREEDADSEPEGDSQYPGDGLSAIEEYRGFIVDGAHRRTNPRRKDLFIHSTHPELIGDAAQLPLPIHLIELAEMTDLLTRVINPNFRNDGAGVPLRPESAIQRGLRVFDGGDSGSGVVGRVISLTNLPAPPNDIEAVIVYSQTIRRVSPDRNNATDIDSFDGQKNIQTLGHEIGHALQMYHWRKDTSSGESCAADPLMPDRALTVLVTCWFHPTNDLNDPKWNAIPHIYDEIDLRQLRIKK